MSAAVDASALTLAGSRVVTPSGVLDPGWVEVIGRRIGRVGAGAPPDRVDRDLAGHWLVPGFVDMHVHGGGGGAFASADDREIGRAVAFHRRHGTTTLMASLVTAGLDELSYIVAALADHVTDGLLAGIHLEGPFLNPAYRGAHDARLLRTPTRTALNRLLGAGRGTVRMVTLAPEIDGGISAVRQLVDADVIAAIGHTGASYELTRMAIDAGARVATHLFNGMAPPHHRRPGPALALLTDPRVVIELINDGQHLHPDVVRSVVTCAGSHRAVLVTDAIPATGLGDGQFRLGGRAITVRNNIAELTDGSSLAGSTLTMSAAFRRVALELGVEAAVAMACTTPARALDRDDVGAIATGLEADLTVLDTGFNVVAVMVRGRWCEGTGT